MKSILSLRNLISDACFQVVPKLSICVQKNEKLAFVVETSLFEKIDRIISGCFW